MAYYITLHVIDPKSRISQARVVTLAVFITLSLSKGVGDSKSCIRVKIYERWTDMALIISKFL